MSGHMRLAFTVSYIVQVYLSLIDLRPKAALRKGARKALVTRGARCGKLKRDLEEAGT